jgi:hypothetical protein
LQIDLVSYGKTNVSGSPYENIGRRSVFIRLIQIEKLSLHVTANFGAFFPFFACI